jgi:hypothetical protein
MTLCIYLKTKKSRHYLKLERACIPNAQTKYSRTIQPNVTKDKFT